MPCPIAAFVQDPVAASILIFSVKIFLLIWIIFVPIAITSRLDKIVKLLQDQNKK